MKVLLMALTIGVILVALPIMGETVDEIAAAYGVGTNALDGGFEKSLVQQALGVEGRKVSVLSSASPASN